MKTILNHTKRAISNLLFDRRLVSSIKKAAIDENQLYNQLMSGRITLQEYLHATGG